MIRMLWEWLCSHQIFSIVLILGFVISAFFSEALFLNKTYFTPDAQTAAFMTEKLKESVWTKGIIPQWMPYLFCGMPSAGSLTYNPFSYFPGIIIAAIQRLLPVSVVYVFILHYLFAGLGVFLFVRRKVGGLLPGLFGGLSYMMMPYMIAMTVYGHGSQMMTAAYLPWVIYAIDRLFAHASMKNIAIYALLTGLMLQRGHIQVAYYGLLVTGFYAVFSLVGLLARREYSRVVRVLGAYAGGTLLAFAFAAVVFLPVREYTPFSIRGASSILASGSSQQGTGVDFDYATQWSFSPGEMLTFIVPSYYGFGGHTYWGNMPFTDYPNYMGIIILVLAIYGVIRKVPLYRFLGITVIAALLISFGRHLPVLYRLLYEHFPYFNKFRVPVMILLVVEVCMAILAGMGLDSLIRTLAPSREASFTQQRTRGKNIMIAIGVIIGIVILMTLFQSGLKTTMAAKYPARYPPQIQAQLNEMRFNMFMKDLWVVSLIVCSAMICTIFMIYRKISASTMAVLLITISSIDMWIVGVRVKTEPTPESNQQRLMKSDGLVEFLESDSTLFRIYPTAHLFRETKWASHGVQSVGGYHAAKPRRYQDFLVASGLENGLMNDYFRVVEQDGQQMLAVIPNEQVSQTRRKTVLGLLDMLNVKYIVSPYPIDEPAWLERTQVTIQLPNGLSNIRIYENHSVLPRVYLVGDYEIIPDAKQQLRRLVSGDFDPRSSVLLETDPPFMPLSDSTAVVSIHSSDIHGITLSTRSDHAQILVFTETFYPPGWRAYIDDKKTSLFAANHCFTALCVPAGMHDIQIRYESAALWIGLSISVAALLICTVLLYAGKWKKAGKDYVHKSGVLPVR